MNTKPSKITVKKQDLPRRNFSTQTSNRRQNYLRHLRKKKTSHEHGYICSFLKRCEIPFNGPPSPLPLFSVVPLALRFVGTRRRPNNVKGGGVGGPFLRVAQITSF